MSNRLEIELTSSRGDGGYTWRAAGARQPKGVIDGHLVGGGAKVGDVLRVEAEFEIDGITILSVLPSKEKAPVAGRIEILADQKPVAGVTTVLLTEGGRGGRRDLLDSPRRQGRPGSRDRRPEGTGRPASGRPDGAGRTGSGRPDGSGRPSSSRSPGDSSSRTPPESRREQAPADKRRTRPPRPPRRDGALTESRPPRAGENGEAPPSKGGRHDPALKRAGADQAGARPRHGRADAGSQRSPARDDAARDARAARAPFRLEVGGKRRDLLLESLAPEQRPIAERLVAGGLPAVRRAVDEERERARTEGRADVNSDAIVALAEELLPAVKQAVWLDRAEAVTANLERISLRDLRTTVVAAAPRDDEGRALARQLREELDRRITKLRAGWEDQITHALSEGRVLQALRLSAQPPEPTARFPAALVEPVAAGAGAAMTATTPPERWLALLEAAVGSPIRRQVRPAGVPEDPTGAVERAARLAAGSLPALAPLLGLTMPPPPKPVGPTRPARGPRPLSGGRSRTATRAPSRDRSGPPPQAAAEEEPAASDQHAQPAGPTAEATAPDQAAVATAATPSPEPEPEREPEEVEVPAGS